MKYTRDKLYSGGRDGKIIITNTESLTLEATINIGHSIIALDIDGVKALVGCINGMIYSMKNVFKEVKDIIMESHSEGAVSGLCSVDQENILTSGDDN